MSTITQDDELRNDGVAASSAISQTASPDAIHAEIALADGADAELGAEDASGHAEVERELEQMKSDTELLQREGLLSADEARANHELVERTRKTFREMSPQERNEVIRRRRDFGRRLLEQQVSGASVVKIKLQLRHTRMKPLFEQWWPYINRMSLNMQRFGRETFKADEKGLNNAFEKQLGDLEAYVEEQLTVATAYREREHAAMQAQGRFVMNPSVSRASLERDVEVYTPFSMRVLNVLQRFDQTMDHFDFLVWNGIRGTEDVDSEVNRFLRKFHPIGVRGYQAHARLMLTVRGG